MLRLETLVSAHNDAPEDLPKFSYTAVICKGDLFVLSIGVNGPLVNHSFRMLEHIEHGEKVLEETVYLALQRYQDKFTKRADLDGRPLYHLSLPTT